MEILAEIALRKGFLEVAVSLLKPVLRSGTASRQSCLLMSEAAERAGFGTKAVELLAMADQAPQDTTPAVQTPRETDKAVAPYLDLLARLLSGNKQERAAAALWLEALGLDPENVDYLKAYVASSRQVGEPKPDVDAHGRVAFAKELGGTLEMSDDEEIERAETALEACDEDRLLGAQTIAAAWLRRGKTDRARRVISEALIARPDVASSKLVAAAIELEARDYPKALGFFSSIDRTLLSVDHQILASFAAFWSGDDALCRSMHLSARLGIGKAQLDPRTLSRGYALAELDFLMGRPVNLEAFRVDEWGVSGRVFFLERLCQISGPYLRNIDHKDGLQRLLRDAGSDSLQPETLLLPEEHAIAASRVLEDDRAVWIFKRANLFGANGIRLLRGPKPDLGLDLTGPAILQRYIESPLLVDGLKAHLRVYLLMVPEWSAGFYRSTEGIVRLAVQPFSSDSLDNLAIHVTNTNFNKEDPDLFVSASAQGDEGHVRDMRCIAELVLRDGEEPLDAILNRFSMSIYRAIRRDWDCPHVAVLALDIMLDEELRPWLMEIESRPMFRSNGVAVVERVHALLADGADSILRARYSRSDRPVEVDAWHWIDAE